MRAEIGVQPERCIVIEDSISGVIAARAAGATVVGLLRAALFPSRLDSLLLQSRLAPASSGETERCREISSSTGDGGAVHLRLARGIMPTALCIDEMLVLCWKSGQRTPIPVPSGRLALPAEDQ
jgi:hypothetical protein